MMASIVAKELTLAGPVESAPYLHEPSWSSVSFQYKEDESSVGLVLGDVMENNGAITSTEDGGYRSCSPMVDLAEQK